MFDPLNAFLDPALILPFQWALMLGIAPFWAFFIGVTVVSVLATIIGELSMAGIYYLNHRYLEKDTSEMVKFNNLSIQAIAQQDKGAYKACNHMANEAFGRTMFSGIALFAASMWPAFFVLGWLSYRFSDADIILPGLDYQIAFQAIFIPVYIISRIVFAKVLKRRMWPFTRIEAWRQSVTEACEREEMLGWDALIKDEPADESAKDKASSA
jgi:hypothetical protein